MPNSAHTALVVKANGEREPFIGEKLYQSLVRSGADSAVAHTITAHVSDCLHDGDHTRDIYDRAFAELRRIERPMAARYSVKHALLELGPSGYPFEDYLAEIYRSLGYLTQTRVMLRGKCVEHELDLMAVRNDDRIGAEVKFHNNSALKSDIKVALYVKARFDDISQGTSGQEGADFTSRMIVTNTKFTAQAELYGACSGLTLVSWDYPEHGNLRELIEQTRVHPLSCMTTLSKSHKRQLMDRGIVLCRQIREHTDELEGLGLKPHAIERVLGEAQSLCPA